MAQTEKYMLLEKEEMQQQKIEAVQGMLNTTMGRDVNHQLGRPVETSQTSLSLTLGESLSLAKERSPEVKAKEKMVRGAEAKVKLAGKEYYPDFTISANYFYRTGPFLDMWNLTASIPLPIYQYTKQNQPPSRGQGFPDRGKTGTPGHRLHACSPPSAIAIPWQRPLHG